jgi:16S rRNA C1402 N4-methylase RsmH
MKNVETQKIEEIRNKYSTKKQKNYEEREQQDFKQDFKPKEKRSDSYSFAPKIFNEIRQINNEIDELEKELEKTFKFYNNEH